MRMHVAQEEEVYGILDTAGTTRSQV
jgi:hypothetical protein